MSSLYYNISIEGTIGVGKTSLAKLISEKLDSKLILEEFEDNPFLPDFYKDSTRYAFQTQLFFLLSRYKQQMEFQQIDIFTKSEYTKSASTKNLTGNITSYNVEARVIFKVLHKNSVRTFEFSENSTINNQENQLDETIYENNIKKNFAELFSNKLIAQLLKLEWF